MSVLIKITDIEIKTSAINGTGVYASRRFEAGETVLRWDVSLKLSTEEAELLPDSEKKYLHPFDTDRFILVQEPERFVNHSCEHNTEVKGFSDVAVKQILPGEEITSNYEQDGAGQRFTCNCGSSRCRKVIGIDTDKT